MDHTGAGQYDRHAALQCPLMLEGRNPAGFESNPLFFGYFTACFLDNAWVRRCGLTKIGVNKLKRRLTYVFDLQYEKQAFTNGDSAF